VTEIDSTRRSYDEVAERYTADFLDELRHKPLDRALLDAFAELVGDGTVADVGCGPGHIAAHLAGNGVRAVGLDLSPRMCAEGSRLTGLAFAAGDLCALPVRSQSLAGLTCCYAVIHLDGAARRRAYREFVRVLLPGGYALISFHTSDEDTPTGQARTATEFLGHEVELTFHFLDPAAEERALAAAGFESTARLDREPHPGVEHLSRRSYLLVRRPGSAVGP
jgi:SAM-dependent methyltransferase